MPEVDAVVGHKLPFFKPIVLLERAAHLNMDGASQGQSEHWVPVS